LSEHLPFANWPRGLAPLGYRDFALYWVGMITTNTGRWVELTGLVWLVYELTNSPFLVGLLGAARALPAFPLSPIAGVIADRVNQRRLLFVTQSLTFACSFCLGLLVVTGVVELWHVYLQVVIQSVIYTIDSSVRQALFPRLVPRPVLEKAVTLSVASIRVSRFVGPALGGLLIADFGESAPFFVNAVSLIGLMAAVFFMRFTPVTGNRVAASFRGQIVEGVRYILSKPVLSGVLKLELVYGVFEINPAIIAILGREILNTGPEALGFLLSAPALGSLMGITLLLSTERARHGRFSLSCTLAYACVLVFLAFSSNYAMSFVALVMIGLLEVSIVVTRNSIMQLAAPEHMRGRIMANMGMITRGIGPLAETQSGFLSSAIGAHFAILVSAGVIGTAGALTVIFNPALWRFSLDERSAAE
jgi:MFS family permease